MTHTSDSSPSVLMLSVSPMIFDTRIQRECLALQSLGYNVSVLYVEDQEFVDGLPDPEKSWNEYLASTRGIRTIRVFLRTRQWRRLPKSMQLAFQALELGIRFSYLTLKANAKIVQSNDLTPGVFALLSKALLHSKVVYDAHELGAETGNPSFRNLLLEFYERTLIRYSSLTFTVNHWMRDIMQNRYGRNVRVLGNKPTYTPASEFQKNRIRVDSGFTDGDKIIAYVGYLSLARGVDKTVEALKYLPENVKFAIMGTGRILEFKEMIKQVAIDNAIAQSRIRFIGPYPSDDVIKVLAGADVSMLLYQGKVQNELLNVPNKLFQSIMAQVPVVASSNKSLTDFVYGNPVGHIGVTVDQSNPISIARGIDRVLYRENHEAYVANNRELSSRYSWQEEVKVYTDGYKQLTGSSV